MQVTTNIRKMDLIRLNLLVLPRQRSTYIGMLVLALFAFAVICWMSGFPQTTVNWVAALVGSLAGGIVGTLVGVVFSIVSILLMSSVGNGILGEHVYTLSADGLHEQTVANEGLSKWSGIRQVEMAGQYLIFQISGYLFHIVPQRSFASRAGFEAFAAASIEHWEKAHRKPAG
ncbi:YcxB family protein [Halopseudomonas salegens]|uniref:YcxB-like protein n=1 Tax=Halopseudomonas salegens TaxID=1434072 RepID=A0A1H2E8C9_9GAMM|nr:YcxB family protein [Halopseudomonas salegens]SDT91333.1 YcxB-like protein [Halopseudomonas salegens]